MHCGNQSGMATLLQQKSFMKTVTNVVVNGTDNGQAGASATIVASSTVSAAAAAAVPNGGTVASANHPAQTFLPVTAKPANHQQQMHHHQPPALIAVSSTVPPLSAAGLSSSSTSAATTTTTIINANSTQQLHKHPPLLQQIFIQKNHQTSMGGGGVGQTTGLILVPATMEASASGTSFAGRTFAGRTILRAPGGATTISLASVAQVPSQIDGSFRQQHIMNATTTGSTHPISDVLTTTTTATPSCPVNNTVVALQTVNGGIHSQQQQQPQQSGDGFGSSSMMPPVSHAPTHQQQSPSTCAAAGTPVADNTTREATTVATVAGDSQDTKETIPDEGEQEAEPEIDIVINNVVCSFSVRCHLNLRDIAMNGYNVEFRRENGMMTMKLRRPYTTASIWSSGKITCTGATSEDQAKVAARRYSRCLQTLGYNVRLRNFRIVNVLGTCSMPWGIMIVNFSERYRKEASYEPELHPGVTYKLLKPKATLKIFSTGSITVTAASVAFVQEAIEHIYPRVYEFRKKRTPLEKQELLKPPVFDVQDTDQLIEEDAGGDIEMLDAMDGTEAAEDSSGDTVPNKYSTKAIQKSSSSRVNSGLERQRIRRHRPPGREAMYSDPMTDDDDDDANVSEI
ncbi:uncharacterized protein LOC128270647 [Anopheles cruzii]|uniref:uncharacterized protein LOC128270647 n=1 Tax=Anopheles cruzii TaxID=68878 RepID=UPI0022EC3363|nr:uncharacterized protein LOC128270647 [Anopheles cruzii]